MLFHIFGATKKCIRQRWKRGIDWQRPSPILDDPIFRLGRLYGIINPKLKGVLINPECIDIRRCEERSDVAISTTILEATAGIPTVVLAFGGTPWE
jgi:hypothetical protein